MFFTRRCFGDKLVALSLRKRQVPTDSTLPNCPQFNDPHNAHSYVSHNRDEQAHDNDASCSGRQARKAIQLGDEDAAAHQPRRHGRRRFPSAGAGQRHAVCAMLHDSIEDESTSHCASCLPLFLLYWLVLLLCACLFAERFSKTNYRIKNHFPVSQVQELHKRQRIQLTLRPQNQTPSSFK